ncbi:MAG: hypothetical protein ABI446_09990 [Gemmatimonadaceae bacterium]
MILVGHSAGGWDAAGWDLPELVRQPIFVSQVVKGAPICFYHSRDDDVVPFEHLQLYNALVPTATFRDYDCREHQFNNDMTDVARDIARL